MEHDPIWQPAWTPAAPCVYLRQELTLSAPAREAWVECSCPGPYQLYLNGHLAGRGPGTGLWPRSMWERFDLVQWTQPGANVLLVQASRPLDPAGPAWLAARGAVQYADGGRLEIGSGPAWRVLAADPWQAHAEPPIGRAYLAMAEEAGWSEGRCRPEAWLEATPVPAPTPGEWAPRPASERGVWARGIAAFGEVPAEGPLRFEPKPGAMRTTKCVHREGLLEAGKVWTLVQTRSPERAAYLVLDFGRTVTGYLRLRLRGQAGALVDVGFAAALERVDEGLRYVTAAGLQDWTDLRLHTCRYLVLRLAGCPDGIEVDSASLVERRVELLEAGEIAGSGRLEALWSASRTSIDESRQEVYRSGSARAGTDWLSAYPLALEDAYLTGDLHTAACTLASGLVPEGDPPQLFAHVLMLDAYHTSSGDRERVSALAPAALDGLQRVLERAPDASWTAAGGRWTYAALSVFGALAARAAARLCRGLGERRAAGAWDQADGRLVQALRRTWCPALGLCADAPGAEQASQWVNALALGNGLVGDRAAGVEAWLADSARPPDDLWEAFFTVAGLGQAGLAEQGLAMVEQHWGRLVEREGRSWAERAKATGSPALPGPSHFVGSCLLGIRPGAPACRVLEVRPQPSGLGRLRGRVWTRRGSVEVGWSVETERFVLDLGLSEPGQTHLGVPRLGRRFPTVSVNGETLWRNEKFYPNSFVRTVEAGEEEIGLELQDSGRFEVVVE